MKIAIPYKPRDKSIHELLESHRFCVLVAHRRYGKTVLAVNHIIKQACTCEKPRGIFGYVAPFRVQAKAVAWDYLKHFTGNIPDRVINESELSISLPCPGGVAKCRIFGADNPDSLRGGYFDGVVLDEVAQMKAEVWGEIIQPALADRKGWAVFIGTPKGLNLFSEIYYQATGRQADPASNWASRVIPVTESNSLAPEEVERLKNEMSENAFRQEMLCDFTASSDDVLISLDEARQALARQSDPALSRLWPLVLGVDIARYGDDATVFFPRRGNIAMAPIILRKKSNTDVAHRLIALINELDPGFVNIDQGQGTGVIDILRDATQGQACVISEVPFGGRPLNEHAYFNRRAEMWRLMADWLKNGGELPKGPLAETLIADLTAPQYSFDAQGRIRLEAKDEIKKRLGRSTDLGDALALTFATPIRPNVRENKDWAALAKQRRLKAQANIFGR